MSALTWYCGDTHGDLSHIVRTFERAAQKPEAIVHLGDITPDAPLHEVLPEYLHDLFWWIPGNHDYDRPELMARVFKSRLANRCLHRRVMNVAGVRTAGLGGHFKGRIWMPPQAPEYKKRSRKVADDGAIWPEDIAQLSNNRAEVLVTHEAPTSYGRGSIAINDLAKALGVKRLYHGHHHVDYVSEINRGQTIVVGVGFRSIVSEPGGLICKGPRQRSFLPPPCRS